ncbi:hypothetical protein BURPS406E_P0034 [Burkholderia pseudomallei 406e]|uniref:Uncharacterized protein n=2 Tax=Burkholderia pseudomallei TaxID=28450 RepID=A3P2E5_BURP0|nr:hypothetical protein [Burkholderia pseudomallei]ABN92861.1 hypothetical protein BURPS1106A_A0462 [Burkholderia pseudomallei 1106a]EDO86779.1 hypothetical protein BURPS406E_P0034 [Burkholderia pseudomallei 406e]EDO92708.1 hypothetical protein BURPSPAST_E0028 [Burkholderia pseudomallei Pasteur 52237]EDS84928.1 hypothetical protein BURPSS13_J0365 [Burkholderia pseudomallei S13]EDU10264.1 hypothetical protein BURPS1655_C0352 [Burkholderia pseudomallei 1655]KGW97398.1 hypothetical protein Y048_
MRTERAGGERVRVFAVVRGRARFCSNRPKRSKRSIRRCTRAASGRARAAPLRSHAFRTDCRVKICYNLLLGTTDETSYSGGFTRYAAHGAVFVD